MFKGGIYSYTSNNQICAMPWDTRNKETTLVGPERRVLEWAPKAVSRQEGEAKQQKRRTASCSQRKDQCFHISWAGEASLLNLISTQQALTFKSEYKASQISVIWIKTKTLKLYRWGILAHTKCQSTNTYLKIGVLQRTLRHLQQHATVCSLSFPVEVFCCKHIK